MSYLAADLAVFERLVGAPLDSDGRPKCDEEGKPVNRLLFAPPLSHEALGGRLPSYGIRIPNTRQGVDTKRSRSTHNTRPFNPRRDFVFNTWRNVPVFPVNIEGREYPNVWPCVTYYCQDEAFNPTTYIYADPIEKPASDAPTVEVTNRRGQLLAAGPQTVEHRPHPDPYDLTYVIQVYAKDHAEMRWICDAVRKVFPARGALEVEQMNGDRLVFDMLLQDITNMDVGAREVAMGLSDDEQRYYSRLFTYRVEGYIDNTGGFEANNNWEAYAITNRILELVNMQSFLYETVDVEAGKSQVV